MQFALLYICDLPIIQLENDTHPKKNNHSNLHTNKRTVPSLIRKQYTMFGIQFEDLNVPNSNVITACQIVVPYSYFFILFIMAI